MTCALISVAINHKGSCLHSEFSALDHASSRSQDADIAKGRNHPTNDFASRHWQVNRGWRQDGSEARLPE